MNHRSRGLLVGMTALGLLSTTLTACGTDAFERCVPEESASAAAAGIDGTYEGVRDAEGVRLTLTNGSGKAGNTLTVENWPTGDYYRDELGETFDGSGTWEIDRSTASEQSPLLRLHFDKPKPLLRGDTIDLLTITSDDKRVVLYDNTDPDTCPSFRLDLEKP
ncbi:hypothetical protein ACFPM3_12075 [Streptomyces coeruleoprunus]|uniref:Lipoprotein n=1 Tax=Streptomyces coeruleoprunus TaxID=285563 RepID=A0ABV9XDN7_9ACTN